jgi:hypothetical protein
MTAKRLRDRIEGRHLALVSMVVLVALAGCATGGNGTETRSPTETADGTPQGNGTSLPTEASIDNFTAGGDLESEVTPPGELSVSADGVANDTLAAIEGVDSYRLVGNSTLTTRSNNVNQVQDIDRVTKVDRERPALSVNSTSSARGQTQVQESYYVNGTLYQYSPALAPRYGSEWIKQDISENFTEVFNRSDRLRLFQRVIENGTVSLAGAQTVNGERTYRVRVDAGSIAAASILGLNGSNSADAAMVTTFWIDADTSTIVRAEGAVEIVTTQQGQRVVVSGTFLERLTYGGVTVTLPEAASTAVNPTAGA